MGRLDIAARAFPAGETTATGVWLFVTVSNENGSPVTGLSATDFQVHKLQGIEETSGLNTVEAEMFLELTKPGQGYLHGLPGCYRLLLSSSYGFNAFAPWTFIIQVQSGKGIGRTPRTFHITRSSAPVAECGYGTTHATAAPSSR
jgi:hypothetical protein